MILKIKAYKEAVEKGKKNHHVVPAQGGWVIIGGVTGKPVDTFGTQQEAIAKAKSIAQNSGTSVYIHGSDGRIRETENYESDRFPPQDTIH